MASSPTFDEISAARELISKPCVLEVLDGLGRDVLPRDAVPADADPAVLEEALQYLRGMGIVEVAGPPGLPARDAIVALTPGGRDLVLALQEATRPEDPT